MNEMKKIVYEERQKLLKALVERNKKLVETYKKLEERYEQLAENKNVHEINKKLHKQLEEMNKKLEERDKQLAKICSKNPVSYTVSSINGKAWQYRRHCMGEYYPTGESVNGFPVFRKGDLDLYVSAKGYWMIGYTLHRVLGSFSGEIVHHGTNPTPLIPPHNGWIVGTGDSWEKDTTLTVLPRSFITYRVPSSFKNIDFLSGDYMPTGDFINSFQIFCRMGWYKKYYILVDASGYWAIGEMMDGKHIKSFVYHPDKDPTPSTPPSVGWKYKNDEFPDNDKVELSPRFIVIPAIGNEPKA